MKPVRCALLMGTLLILTAGGVSAQNAEWKAMAYADLTRPGPMSWLATEIWPDIAAKENAYVRDVLKRSFPAGSASLQLQHASFQIGGIAYVVSIALALDCEAGANHNASGAEHSLCPLRIAMKGSGGWNTIVSNRGCYVDSQGSTAPAVHQFDGAQVQFDPSRREIRLRANVGGAWVAACTRSFSIP